MNQLSLTCGAGHMNIEYLNSRQLATLAVINLVIMIANVTGNTLAIYVLIKTNQTEPIAWELIFVLSIPDFLVGGIGQNFFTVIIYGAKCSVNHALMCLNISCTFIILYNRNNRH